MQLQIEFAGLITAFLLIGFLTYKGLKLYWVLVIATGVLVITGNRPLVANIDVLISALTDSSTLLLTPLVVTISVLGYLLKQTGLMEDMVNGFRRLFKSNRALLISFPALVSLLTVPGGAIISAPMVDEAGRGQNEALDLSMVNIVFRHLFLLIIPYYTPLVFIIQETGLNPFSIILFNLPVTLVGFVFAYYYIFGRRQAVTKPERSLPEETFSRTLLRIIVAISPFILVIVLGFLFHIYLPLAFLISIVYTLFLALPKTNRVQALRDRLAMLWPGINWGMVLVIVSIMVFKTFIQEASVLPMIVAYLLEKGIPLVALLFFVPLLFGFMTGNTIASLGISMPLLLPALPGGTTVEAGAILLISAFCGYVGSPIHMCSFLTVEYFKAPLMKTLAKINLVTSVMLASALVFYLLR